MAKKLKKSNRKSVKHKEKKKTNPIVNLDKKLSIPDIIVILTFICSVIVLFLKLLDYINFIGSSRHYKMDFNFYLPNDGLMHYILFSIIPAILMIIPTIYYVNKDYSKDNKNNFYISIIIADISLSFIFTFLLNHTNDISLLSYLLSIVIYSVIFHLLILFCAKIVRMVVRDLKYISEKMEIKNILKKLLSCVIIITISILLTFITIIFLKCMSISNKTEYFITEIKDPNTNQIKKKLIIDMNDSYIITTDYKYTGTNSIEFKAVYTKESINGHAIALKSFDHVKIVK